MKKIIKVETKCDINFDNPTPSKDQRIIVNITKADEFVEGNFINFLASMDTTETGYYEVYGVERHSSFNDIYVKDITVNTNENSEMRELIIKVSTELGEKYYIAYNCTPYLHEIYLENDNYKYLTVDI